jgi:hypothetical protein
MTTTHNEPRAVALARAHVEAWTTHDFEGARRGLAEGVKVTATTTAPYPPATSLTGVDDYMEGLVGFAQAIVPGSARVLAATGDERNALLMLTVDLTGPDGSRVTLPGARLYLLDEDGRIADEQVIFYAAAE